MSKLFLGALLLIVALTSALADTGSIFYRSGEYMALRPGSCLVTNLTVPAEVIPQGANTAGGLLMAFLPRFKTLQEYIDSAPTEQAKNDIYVACGLIAPPVVDKKWLVATNGIRVDRPAKELVIDPSTGEQTRVNSNVRYRVGEDCDNSVTPVYSEGSTGGRQWRFFGEQTKYVVVCEEK